MAFSINVDDNSADIAKRLELAGKDFQFASANALTRLAFKARDAVKAETIRAFDRPKPFTQNAFVAVPATKANPTAFVRHKTGHSYLGYLERNVRGGPVVEPKKSDLLLRAKFGGVTAAVPARTARRDAYGNWAKAERTRAMADALAQPERRTPGKTKNRRREFFVPADDSSLAPGVYVRQGDAIKRLLSFTAKTPTYRPIFRFYEVAAETVRTSYMPIFREVVAKLRLRG